MQSFACSRWFRIILSTCDGRHATIDAFTSGPQRYRRWLFFALVALSALLLFGLSSPVPLLPRLMYTSRGIPRSKRPLPAPSCCRAAPAQADDHRSTVLYMRFTDPLAGLGNKMFQYASGIGLAMRYGAEARLVVDSAVVGSGLASMRRVFRLSALPQEPDAPSPSEVAMLLESGWGRYDAARFDNRSYFERRQTTVVGYLQSWRYFEPVANRVRREFSLTPFADALADAFLRRTGAIESGQVIVGLHVRRGDMGMRPDLYTLAPPEYVLKAVEHYLTKYGGDDATPRRGLTLVVATNDRHWVEVEVVPHLPVSASVVFTGLAPEEDMAVLSRCNHSIVTAGTFSWWSAWLAGGDVIYYKDFIRRESLLYAGHDPADYYPPHWLALT